METKGATAAAPEAGSVERAAHEAGPPWRLPAAAGEARARHDGLRHRHCDAGLLKLIGRTRAPGTCGSMPTNESCDSAKASPLTLLRPRRHQIDTGDPFDRCERRGARGAARCGGAGNGNDANAGAIDLVDRPNRRAGRHQ